MAGGRARAGSSHLTRGTGGSPSPILCVAGRFCKRFLWSFLIYFLSSARGIKF